jgi:hypothetical protein
MVIIAAPPSLPRLLLSIPNVTPAALIHLDGTSRKRSWVVWLFLSMAGSRTPESEPTPNLSLSPHQTCVWVRSQVRPSSHYVSKYPGWRVRIFCSSGNKISWLNCQDISCSGEQNIPVDGHTPNQSMNPPLSLSPHQIWVWTHSKP